MLSSSRATNLLLVVSVAVGVGIVATLATGVRGGPLDPPGPPASTGVTRIFQPADCAGFPIQINMPGAYELAQNITMPTACTQDGIWILSFDVTLDLNGFTLRGVTGAKWGIISNGSATIARGQVVEWPTGGIFVQNTKTIVSELLLRNNGVGVTVTGSSIVRNNVVADNAVYGIKLQNGSGGIVADNTVTGNGSTARADNAGILLEATSGALVHRNAVSRTANGSPGILLKGSVQIRVSENNSSENGGNGFRLAGNSIGEILEDNSASSNGAEGIYAEAGGGNHLITDNTLVGNSVAGISVNGSFSIITGNTALFNTTNYAIAGGPHDVGPITTAAAKTSPAGNVSN